MLDRGSPDRPSTASHCLADVERLLFVEAQHLDDKTWETWADLYLDDAHYWVPSWLDEYELVADPDTQVSYIYHTSRAQLRERIGRIQSRKSITALPLPRTLHVISNIVLTERDELSVDARSSWTTHVFDPRTRRQHLHFGTYEHRLVRNADSYRIARKKIVIMNDCIPTVVDFYSI
ncbi:aromatic-ring-hydroxylating dioxygenase subunit beta [Bradyrhizobium cenepequi]|uniref:aromatic-ring-hydroxylating dioxygenase subunit beta n=1 Tax=Bradyrhizobium cenepequi TaxID=2821403 RepID=UPI001CE2903E|nr:aromatic-ring-hydroxylating dioxygenase subunit beta [Bradyrhizobium cenepequi]MCA6107010.1 aromatic-ring-hydroxylating dioxygenase subunit beta [Bradyrhizobium cenepequi]